MIELFDHWIGVKRADRWCLTVCPPYDPYLVRFNLDLGSTMIALHFFSI